MSKLTKYAKKRKRTLDQDTTMQEVTRNEGDFGGDAPRSRSTSPKRYVRRLQKLIIFDFKNFSVNPNNNNFSRSRRKGRQGSPEADGGNE